MCLVEFVQSPWGVVCVGVLSSVIGSVFYTLVGHLVAIVGKKIKRKRFIRRLVVVGEAFSEGYLTALAQAQSTFHQTLLVSHYEIKITIAIAKTFGFALGGLVLLILFNELLLWKLIIVSVTCLIVAINCKRIKKLFKTYEMMFDYVFGDDYKKHMMEGVKLQWDSMTGRKQNIKEEYKSDNATKTDEVD